VLEQPHDACPPRYEILRNAVRPRDDAHREPNVFPQIPLSDVPDGRLLAAARNRNPTMKVALLHRRSAAALTFDLSDCSVTQDCQQSVLRIEGPSEYPSTTFDQSLFLAASLPRILAVDVVVSCHFGAFSPG
jgi:hypothetical protein